MSMARNVTQENSNRHQSRAGIRAGQVEGFLKDSYNVVAASLKLTRSLTTTPLTLVDGGIRNRQTASRGE
jgi:hypothetical protein